MATITNRHRPMTDERVELWEAFGCMPPDRQTPTVRRWVDRSGRPATITYYDYDCLDPDTGVHLVAVTLPDGTKIHAHGDDTAGVFVRVHGMSEEQVTDMYRRVEAAMPAFLDAIWRPRQLGVA